jgi:formylglycine-generating enzyme required for sulfatase activity
MVCKTWRRLEELNPVGGLGAGALLGALVGWVALYQAGGGLGLVLGVLVLAAGIALVWLGRVVVVPLPEPVPAPTPQPVPFSVIDDIPGLLSMVVLPGGEFLMGSANDDEMAYAERPQHPVTVSGFCMATTPVTRALYREVMGRGRPEWEADGRGGQLPANYVTWTDAVEFCNALSRRQGIKPCYYVTILAGPVVYSSLNWDRLADGYRLPTEAEWEYAARAGTTTWWFFGDEEQDLGHYAWFVNNADGQVHPVGEKEPNPWGLYDMLGNVWEWCWDWYAAYMAEPADDPEGPAGGSYRVVRGGSAWNVPWVLRSAGRDGGSVRDVPGYVRLDRGVDSRGFRCVRVPGRRP